MLSNEILLDYFIKCTSFLQRGVTKVNHQQCHLVWKTCIVYSRRKKYIFSWRKKRPAVPLCTLQFCLRLTISLCVYLRSDMSYWGQIRDIHQGWGDGIQTQRPLDQDLYVVITRSGPNPTNIRIPKIFGFLTWKFYLLQM